MVFGEIDDGTILHRSIFSYFSKASELQEKKPKNIYDIQITDLYY